MIIYHITNGQLYSTQVIVGFRETHINHYKKTIDKIQEKHKHQVKELVDNGEKVYITGGTHSAAVYEGYFANRKDLNEGYFKKLESANTYGFKLSDL